MKNKTTDYTKTKDAYEGNRESFVYQDSSLTSPKKPVTDIYDDDNIPEIDLPGKRNKISNKTDNGQYS